MSEYEPLQKENFMAARLLSPDQSIVGVPPRWRGYEADLTDRGQTVLFPLRVDSFGPIMPHIYARKMRRQDGTDKNGALTMLNLHVNMLYEHNGSYDHDYPTENFLSLLRYMRDKPYSDQPELAEQVGQTFEAFKDAREVQRKKVADSLSRTIGRNELYIVATDRSEPRVPDNDRQLYAARLAGVVNVRNDYRMNYQVVVANTQGNEGYLPQSFYVPAGVCAPASFQPVAS